MPVAELPIPGKVRVKTTDLLDELGHSGLRHRRSHPFAFAKGQTLLRHGAVVADPCDRARKVAFDRADVRHFDLGDLRANCFQDRFQKLRRRGVDVGHHPHADLFEDPLRLQGVVRVCSARFGLDRQDLGDLEQDGHRGSHYAFLVLPFTKVFLGYGLHVIVNCHAADEVAGAAEQGHKNRWIFRFDVQQSIALRDGNDESSLLDGLGGDESFILTEAGSSIKSKWTLAGTRLSSWPRKTRPDSEEAFLPGTMRCETR